MMPLANVHRRQNLGAKVHSILPLEGLIRFSRLSVFPALGSGSGISPMSEF